MLDVVDETLFRFLSNEFLQNCNFLDEVFEPFATLHQCKNENEMYF